MPDYLGNDQRKTTDKGDKPIKSLDEGDIALLKTYGAAPYSKEIRQTEEDIQNILKRVNELAGIKESDTGLAAPALWDLAADKVCLASEHPLQVARCTKIINDDSEEQKYIINVKQFAKFVVDLAETVAPTDIEEGMRVGVERTKYQIHIPLPPKIDPSVTMTQVGEKPDVTYSDVGGCKVQIEKLREVVEMPMLHPEKTDACFFRVIEIENCDDARRFRDSPARTDSWDDTRLLRDMPTRNDICGDARLCRDIPAGYDHWDEARLFRTCKYIDLSRLISDTTWKIFVRIYSFAFYPYVNLREREGGAHQAMIFVSTTISHVLWGFFRLTVNIVTLNNGFSMYFLGENINYGVITIPPCDNVSSSIMWSLEVFRVKGCQHGRTDHLKCSLKSKEKEQGRLTPLDDYSSPVIDILGVNNVISTRSLVKSTELLKSHKDVSEYHLSQYIQKSGSYQIVILTLEWQNYKAASIIESFWILVVPTLGLMLICICVDAKANIKINFTVMWKKELAATITSARN